MSEKKSNFDRSEYMKKVHFNAKVQREKFEQLYPTEKTPNYFDFLKQNSPLADRVISYEVSYQLSYRGETDSIIINPKTFIVFGFVGQEHQIQSRTMNMLLDSKGRNTGNNFNPSALNVIENDTQIKIRPRGMEESKRRPSRTDMDIITTGNFIVKELDSDVKFTNKKGRTGEMKLDIRHFL